MKIMNLNQVNFLITQVSNRVSLRTKLILILYKVRLIIMDKKSQKVKCN